MTGGNSGRGRARRGRHSAPAPALPAALAAALTVLAAAVAAPAAADGSPIPLPTSSASAPVRLPVMPGELAAKNSACTPPSGTVMHAVPWTQQSLDLDRAHELSSGAGVSVAVVDTGVARTAPALAGRVTALGAGAGSDCVGHGTFAAGIVAGARLSGTGVAGVAPAARVLAVNGTGTDGKPDQARVAAGIRAATDAGAEVIDVSLAFPSATNALDSALAYASGHDVLVVAAGVPDGAVSTVDGGTTAQTSAYWPAARTGVLSVVAVDVTGVPPTGQLQPVRADLAAPGIGVPGIGPSGPGHFVADGPSVAAAFVAGTAALVRSYQPRLSAAQVAARLLASAVPAPVPRLDPYAALSTVFPTAAPAVAEPRSDIRPPQPAAASSSARRAYRILGAAALGALGLAAWSLLTRVRRRTAGSR